MVRGAALAGWGDVSLCPPVTCAPVHHYSDEPVEEEKTIGEVIDNEETKKAFWNARKQAVRNAKKTATEPAAAPAAASSSGMTWSAPRLRERLVQGSGVRV